MCNRYPPEGSLLIIIIISYPIYIALSSRKKDLYIVLYFFFVGILNLCYLSEFLINFTVCPQRWHNQGSSLPLPGVPVPLAYKSLQKIVEIARFFNVF